MDDLIKKEFILNEIAYPIYLDTLDEKLWMEKVVLKKMIKRSYKYLAKSIEQLIINEIIDINRNIKKVKINYKETFLYDLTILYELLPENIYNKLESFSKDIIQEYKTNNKKIYLRNGKLYLNEPHKNNCITIEFKINDIVSLFKASSADIYNVLRKYKYNIKDLIYISLFINNNISIEINNYVSNIINRVLIDGFYIDSDICQNNKDKIISITKIADNLVERNNLTDIEKIKYYTNTITYNKKIYDSNTFINNLINSSKDEIIIISKFMDDDIFNLLKNTKVKIKLFTSKNTLITKYHSSIFKTNHDLFMRKTYLGVKTYLIIDNIIYSFDESIINILKNNSICTKLKIDKKELLKTIEL